MTGRWAGVDIARADLWICLVLCFATTAVYSQVRNFEFVNYDDPDYVENNTHLQAGFSPAAIKWAFTSADDGYWFPLTRLSYLLEYRLFGLKSGGYHLTSLLLHTLASVLLFIFLLRATHQRWPSASVAFLFALHPLHVESVAWVAERKDVLCAVFWFLTLWAWVYYTERPSPRRYLLAILPFCLGLMSKPMIVTLPFVLLLLDAWPFRRPFSRKLLIEKLPFLALAAGAAVVTYLAQRSEGAVQSLTNFPLGLRFENAFTTLIVYIAKMFWPADLAVIYPYPKHLPLWQAASAALVVICVSALVLRWFGSRPYLAVGWLWYLVTLAPVIGLVQAGRQARTDHFMYLPMVGLAIMLSWGVADVIRARPSSGRWAVALAALTLAALAPVTWLQIRYWRNSETLFRHAIAVTGANPEAYLNLGVALASTPGRRSDAIAVFEAGLRIDPHNQWLHTGLGGSLLAAGVPANLPMALEHLKTAVRIDPDYADAHSKLSVALARAGRLDEAVDEARAFLRIEPNRPDAHNNLAVALARTGRVTEAIDQARAALRINPDYAVGHCTLGSALLAGAHGPSDEAIRQFREALRIRPQYAEAHNYLGVALARVPGATYESLFEFEEALRVEPDYRPAHVNLAISLAQLPGRRTEAIAHLEAALKIQPDPRLQTTLEQLESAK